MKSGIYRIRNKINGKCYVGSAINIPSRWRLHKSDLNLGTHKNKYLQAAWNKYGEENFVFEILEECPKEILIEREQSYFPADNDFKKYGFYNINPVAGSREGANPSAETREKMRESSRKRFSKSENKKAHSQAIKEGMNNPETIERVTKANIEKWKDPVYRESQIAKSKAVWERPGYREIMSKKLKAKWAERKAKKLAAKEVEVLC